MSSRNIPASVRNRLLIHAREKKQDFNLVLTRYAIERLLYRLSISPHSAQFVLKGALLFDLWFDVPHRPTRDADFLGFGSAEQPRLEQVFRDISAIEVNDGMIFQPNTCQASEIRKEAGYSGVRVTLIGNLDAARCSIQIDIGFGDAVTPAPEYVRYPVILPEFTAPELRVYPRYTVVAEKFHALTSLGIVNSRMKDYFDLWVLSRESVFEGELLKLAIESTFDRRKTPLPSETPIGLSEAFAQDAQKQTQWKAFLRKNGLESLSLQDVVESLQGFLIPVIKAASAGIPFQNHWEGKGPWEKI